MPLIPAHIPASTTRAPWRGVVVGVAAALVFIVGLAVVARATRDGARAPPQRARVEEHNAADAGALDAKARVNALDAGALVAGAVEGPPEEPATAPIVVEGPPIVAADVVAVVVPVLQECLKKALRFDPGLGGRVAMLVVVAGGRLRVSLPLSPSPVLSGCVTTGGASLAWPTAQGERHVVEARLVLDGLRGAVRVESAELHAPE